MRPVLVLSSEYFVHVISSPTEGQENRSRWSSFWSDASFVLICSAGLPHRKHNTQKSLVLGIAVSPRSLRESSRLATPWFAPSRDLSRDLLFSLSTQCLVSTRIALRARCMGKGILLLQGGSVVVDTDSMAIFNISFYLRLAEIIVENDKCSWWWYSSLMLVEANRITTKV